MFLLVMLSGAKRSRNISGCFLACVKAFDLLTSRSLSLRPSRPCRGFPTAPLSTEPVLSEVEGLAMIKG